MFILFLFKDSSFYWTGNKVYGILKEQEEDFLEICYVVRIFFIFLQHIFNLNNVWSIRGK